MELETGKGKAIASAFPPESVRMPKKSLLAAQVMLRVMAFALALAAICVLVTSKQSTTVFGIQFEARFQYSSACKFLFAVDITACAFSLLSLISIRLSCHPESNPTHRFLVFLHDTVLMLLLMAGCAAATAVGYVGRYGQEQSGWAPICDEVGKFCNRVFASTLLSYSTFFCFFFLAIFSAYDLKSKNSSSV